MDRWLMMNSWVGDRRYQAAGNNNNIDITIFSQTKGNTLIRIVRSLMAPSATYSRGTGLSEASSLFQSVSKSGRMICLTSRQEWPLS